MNISSRNLAQTCGLQHNRGEIVDEAGYLRCRSIKCKLGAPWKTNTFPLSHKHKHTHKDTQRHKEEAHIERIICYDLEYSHQHGGYKACSRESEWKKRGFALHFIEMVVLSEGEFPWWSYNTEENQRGSESLVIPLPLPACSTHWKRLKGGWFCSPFVLIFDLFIASVLILAV